MTTRRANSRRCRWILFYIGIQLFSFSSFFFSRNLLTIRHVSYEVIDSTSIILYGGKKCVLFFLPESVRVMDCYLYSRKERFEICTYIQKELSKIGFHERSIQSLEAELAMHVYCYRLGLFVDHARDADLDIKADLRWYVYAGYSFLEIFGI